MIFALNLRRTISALLGSALAASLVLPAPALAQDDAQRIRKLEAEVKALQRKVFPGGDGKYFEPEITAAQPQTTTPAVPTSGPVTDLLVRMDAVESALARLTAQTEINTNALNLLNARVEALESAQAVADTPIPVEPDGGIGDGAGPPPQLSGPEPQPMPEPAAVVEKPDTGDAGDDEYVFGYRLWDAKMYPQAQAQLARMLDLYPTHSRASYARNLLGRAYLDDGKSRQAAEAFLKNYLDNRGGARAPDSLVYLAIATLQLGNKAKACEALEEFRLVYPAEAAGRLATLSGETAAKAGCK